ncbi:MAG TPA: hypothetical protein VJL88_08560, partial [Nitrospira sp.]|nr:hypothetical protein [Nitrospira sp.]
MTGLTRLTGFTICLIAAAFLSLPRHAAAVNLKAKFEGNVTCNLDDSATANTITIAASGATWTCGNYRVQGVGGAAKIIRDETSGDTIQIVNAKISRTAAAPDLHVTFYSTAAHTDPPTSGSSVDVVYRLEAQGYFKRDSTNNLATNSQFKGRGYVQTPASNPEGGTWYYLGSNPPSTSTGYELVWTVCGTAGCSNYFPGTFATPASHFT